MKIKANQNKTVNSVILIALLNLLVVYFSKYRLNGLSLNEFNLLYFGNLLNLIFSVILITGLIIQYFNSKKYSSLITSFISIISVIYFCFSLSFLILVLSNAQFGNIIILGYPAHKMIMGILAIGSFVLQLYLSIFIWGMFLYKGNYLFIKAFTFLMFLSFISIVAGTVFTSLAEPELKQNQIKKHYNYGVVLGAAVWKKNKPSPLFTGRIQTAKNLLDRKIIDKIILTGANAPGENSEAVTAYKFLLSKGVGKNKMIYEEKTNTTSEQIKYLKFGISAYPNSNKFLIISDKFHLFRVKAICDFFNIRSDTYGSEYKLGTKNIIYHNVRESVGLIIFWLFAI